MIEVFEAQLQEARPTGQDLRVGGQHRHLVDAPVPHLIAVDHLDRAPELAAADGIDADRGVDGQLPARRRVARSGGPGLDDGDDPRPLDPCPHPAHWLSGRETQGHPERHADLRRLTWEHQAQVERQEWLPVADGCGGGRRKGRRGAWSARLRWSTTGENGAGHQDRYRSPDRGPDIACATPRHTRWRCLQRSQDSMKPSRSPSRTAPMLPTSWSVRRSFTIWYGCST